MTALVTQTNIANMITVFDNQINSLSQNSLPVSSVQSVPTIDSVPIVKSVPRWSEYLPYHEERKKERKSLDPAVEAAGGDFWHRETNQTDSADEAVDS